MSTPQHSRLINAAAKAALRPLGCVQKGRSRTWLDDRSWWIGVIEFQPSSWAKGSYLNVGACWLWYEKDHLSFDAGNRVGSFQPFMVDEQFAPVAKKLAERASQEVIALRGRFPSPSHVQTWLAAKPCTSIWDHYHLAVSTGLSGETAQSKQSFADVISDPDERPWATEIRRRAAEFMRCLELGNGFEAEVMGTVKRTRSLLGLPPLPEDADARFE
ncbi:hypothetical protein [Dyella acidiphila]|uniref:DUF4304 domain-containing protein n=1 Tax=Dyella acidiphila TaxID=2775866 RepID=A0ABR9G789_9GAMM|nr:hypothetical protein [Dyella acidiphila]MBE1159910.1 hypothetical protein [Dyella acidiphila]